MQSGVNTQLGVNACSVVAAESRKIRSAHCCDRGTQEQQRCKEQNASDLMRKPGKRKSPFRVGGKRGRRERRG